MIDWIIKKLVGSKNTRMVKRLRPVVDRINALEVEYQSLSVDQLRAKTAAWKEELSKLPEAEAKKLLDLSLEAGWAGVIATSPTHGPRLRQLMAP